jgi:hypothetical protein
VAVLADGDQRDVCELRATHIYGLQQRAAPRDTAHSMVGNISARVNAKGGESPVPCNRGDAFISYVGVVHDLQRGIERTVGAQ